MTDTAWAPATLPRNANSSKGTPTAAHSEVFRVRCGNGDDTDSRRLSNSNDERHKGAMI